MTRRRTTDPSQQAIVDQIFAGARDAGVHIEGTAEVEATAGNSFTVRVYVDADGQPTSATDGPSIRLDVRKDGLDWGVVTTEGDTHASTTGRSAAEATRDALAPLVDGRGGLAIGAGDPSTWEPDVSIYRRPEPTEVGGDGESVGVDGWVPEVSIYRPRDQVEELEPYIVADLEQRDPVRRRVPDPGEGDDEPEMPRVQRVAPGPAFAEPERRRLEPEETNPIARLLKIGIPLLIAVLLVFLGINLFGDDAPDPVTGTPLVGEDESDDIATGTVEDDAPPEEDPPPEDQPLESGQAGDPEGATSLLAAILGSFGGPLTLGDASSVFESPFLLSFLTPESAGAVLTELDQQTIADLEMFLARQALLDLAQSVHDQAQREELPDFPRSIPGQFARRPIILSQFQPDGTAQNTFGGAFDFGSGFIRIVTANATDTYGEVFVIDFSCTENNEAGLCSQLSVDRGVSLGESPDINIECAISDAFLWLGGEAATTCSQEYTWQLDLSGVFALETGTGG